MLAASALLLTACDKDLWELGDTDSGAYVSDQISPIATTLEANDEYQEWVKVLSYSELYSTLNTLYDAKTKPQKFTMFAPTNEALASFYQQKGVGSIEELGKDYAAAMVRTMTYSGDSIKFAEKFTTKVTSLIYTMVAGESVNVTVDGERAGYLLNEKIHISFDHVVCSNGFIYQAEGVVNPLVETIWNRLQERGDSQIMQDALRRTGYDKMLNTAADTSIVLGSFVYKRHFYSLLNVRDDVFHQAGINNVDELTRAITDRSKATGVTPDSLLRQYVQYHILDSRYSLSELVEMKSDDDTIAVASRTLAPNQIYMVTRHYLSPAEGDRPATFETYINRDDIPTQAIDPELSDIEAKNGYVHNLTGWMPVYEPKQTTVVWDLADYSQVREAVGEEIYRPATVTTSETKVDLSRLSCYTVDVPNGRGNTSYTELCYVTCKSNLKDCLYHDRVVFNMGYLGSVQMKTPTLVKGKYRVTVTMAYLTDQSIMRTSSGCKGGLMKVLVDLPEDFDAANEDETLYNKTLVAPYTQITKTTPGVYSGTIYDEIEFTETASHNFKFTIMDPAASTNSKVYLQFDAITFTPIE